jgi:hypothetical protein
VLSGFICINITQVKCTLGSDVIEFFSDFRQIFAILQVLLYSSTNIIDISVKPPQLVTIDIIINWPQYKT